VESGTVESLSLGLMLSHFLIHVEYLNLTTREVNIEVIYKKSLTEIKSFFERQGNNIVKYFCKSEADFVLHVNIEKELCASNFAAKVADNRRKNKNVRQFLNAIVFAETFVGLGR